MPLVVLQVLLLGTDEAGLGEDELPDKLSQDAPRLLLRHCRWLPFVQDRNGLRTRCNEALQALPERLVRCLLDDLPDVLGQGAWSDDAQLSADLQATLSCHPTLIVPVLSAASQLSPTGRLDPSLAEQASMLLGTCHGDAVAAIVRIVMEAAAARDAETRPKRPAPSSRARKLPKELSASSSGADAAAAAGVAGPNSKMPPLGSQEASGSWLLRAMRQVRSRVDLSTMEPDAVAMLISTLSALATSIPAMAVELAKLLESMRSADSTDSDGIDDDDDDASATSAVGAGGKRDGGASVVSAGARSSGSASTGLPASKGSAGGADWLEAGCIALNAVPSRPATTAAGQLAMLALSTARDVASRKQAQSTAAGRLAEARGSDGSEPSSNVALVELDLWMLFAIATAQHHLPKRCVDAACAAAGLALLPPALIRRALLPSFTALRPVYAGMLTVGAQLLRGSSSAGRATGAHLLEQSFLAAAADPALERDVMAAIVSAVGQTRGSSRDLALAVLLSLVSARGPMAAGRVWAFREQLKSLFDFAAPLSDRQARAIYDVLFRAVAGVSGLQSTQPSPLGSSLVSTERVIRPRLTSAVLLAAGELDILLSKQLAHPLPQYRALGLLGSGAKLRWLAAGVDEAVCPPSSEPDTGIAEKHDDDDEHANDDVDAPVPGGAQETGPGGGMLRDDRMTTTINAMLKCAEQSQSDLGIALAELHWSAGAAPAQSLATMATATSGDGIDSGSAWLRGVNFASIEAGTDRPRIGFLQPPGDRLCTGSTGLAAAQSAAQAAMNALFVVPGTAPSGAEDEPPSSGISRAMRSLGQEYEGTDICGAGVLALDGEVQFGAAIGMASVTLVTEEVALRATQSASGQSRESTVRMLALAVGVAPAVSLLGRGAHGRSGGGGLGSGDGPGSTANSFGQGTVGLLVNTLAGRAPLFLRSIVATSPAVFGEIDDVLLAMISLPVPSGSASARALEESWAVVAPPPSRNTAGVLPSPLRASASETREAVLGELERALRFSLEDLAGPRGLYITRGLLAAASWLRATLAHMSVRLLQDLERYYYSAIRGQASADVSVESARGEVAAGWSYLATRATHLVAVESAAARAVFACGDAVAAELAAQAARAGITLKPGGNGSICFARHQAVAEAGSAIGITRQEEGQAGAKTGVNGTGDDDDRGDEEQEAKRDEAGEGAEAAAVLASASGTTASAKRAKPKKPSSSGPSRGGTSAKGAQAKREKQVSAAWAVCVSELPALGPQEACALLALPPALFSERLVSAQVALAAMEAGSSAEAAAAAMPLSVARPLVQSIAAGLEAAPPVRFLQSESMQRLAAARSGSATSDTELPDAGILLGQHVSKCSGFLSALLRRCIRSLGDPDDDEPDDDATAVASAADSDPRLFCKEEAVSCVSACLCVLGTTASLALKAVRAWPFRGPAPADLAELTTALTRVVSLVPNGESTRSAATSPSRDGATSVVSSDRAASVSEDSAAASLPRSAAEAMPLAAFKLCRAACAAFDSLKSLPERTHSLSSAAATIDILSSMLAVRDTFVRVSDCFLAS